MDQLRIAARERGLIGPDAEMTAARAFELVRDMPYQRASSREPETTIREWRGTCSGKHYLLQALLAELGLSSQVIACTTAYEIDPDTMPSPLKEIVTRAGGRIVDVHNYLVLSLPTGDMIVDATWPASTARLGFTVNHAFIPGQNQQIACTPLQELVVPAGIDPQAFKESLLQRTFTPQELADRDVFITTVSRLLQSA